MAKAELKTKVSEASVADFIAAVPDLRRREEAAIVDALHRRVTGCEPRLWGPSIIGYGSYDYTYDSGRKGTSCRGGFSPRKAAMTVYLMGNCCDRKAEAGNLFTRLGKHRTGKSCLYINKLADVDLAVLERLVALSWQSMNEAYPAQDDARPASLPLAIPPVRPDPPAWPAATGPAPETAAPRRSASLSARPA